MKKILKNRKLFKFFYDYQKKYFKMAIGAGVLLFINVLLQLPMPLITRHLIDNIIPAKDFKSLNLLCLLLLGIILLAQLCAFYMRYIIIKYKANIHLEIEKDLYLHIQELPLSYFSKNPSGYVLSRISEVSSVETVMADTFLNILKDVITIIVGAVLILYMHVVLGIISLCVLPFFVLSIKTFHKKIKRINKILQEENAQYQGKLEININSIEKIKSSVKEKSVGGRIISKLTSVIGIKIKAQVINAVAAIVTNFIGMISPFIVLWFGVSEIMNNSLTLGTFVAINAFLTYLYGPARRLSNIGYNISQAMAGLERIFEVFKLQEEDKAGEEIDYIDEIVFDNVHFSYEDSVPVLAGLNLRIRKGEKLAIVGESGKGKSTIVKMLLKFYFPDSGHIYFSGKDSRHIAVKSLRKKIAYISQKPRLLEDELEIPLKEYKADKILKKIRFNKSIINGNIHQSEFSGGEIQKIELVEAILKQADVLIVDEGTSNIDYNAEKIVLDELFSKYKDKIIIFIAHRLSSILDFEEIVVIDKGIIVEAGNHSQLLKKKGQYHFLWGLNKKDGILY